MAVRKISMRLAISGEQEYRAALTNINAELRKMNSALKLVEAEYKSNANSMEALTAKQKALTAVQETHLKKVAANERGLANANKALEEHRALCDRLEKEYEQVKKASEALGEVTKGNAKEHKALSDEADRLAKELAEGQAKVEAAEKGVTRWETELNKAKTALANTNAEVNKNDKYLEEAAQSTDKCAVSIDAYGRELKQAGDAAEKAGKQGAEFGAKTSEAMEALASALAAAGVVASLNKIKDAIFECLAASAAFESAVAGVAKTTNLSKSDISDMAKSLQNMALEIPIATNELVGIAEMAGQLGVNGKENLLEFTSVMAKLGTATNLTAEEAATMLAQFANVTGLPVSQYENLGSSITALGNTSATTESKIIDMAQGIASAGTLAGMRSEDMMALSAAVTSLGIETAAGATSMSKLIRGIDTAVKTGDGLSKWAAVAGTSAEDFARRWRDDAAAALAQFVEGLGQVEEHGGVMANTLKDLGLSEERVSRMTSALANSHGLLSESLNTARDAFEENIALNEEAAIRYETTESKMQLLRNATEGLKVEIGDQLEPAFKRLIETGTGVTTWLTDFLAQHEGLVPAITGVIIVIGALAAGTLAYVGVIKVAIPAIAALKVAMDTASGGITLVISAVIGLIGALVAMAPEADEVTKRLDAIRGRAKDASKAIEDIDTKMQDSQHSAEAAAVTAGIYVDRLSDLEKQGELTLAQQNEYRAIIANLAELYPELNLAIDEHTRLLENGTEAIREQIEHLKEKAVFDAMMEKNVDLLKEYGDQVVNVAEAEQLKAEVEAEINAKNQERLDIEQQLADLMSQRQELTEGQNALDGTNAAQLADINNKYTELMDVYEALGIEITELQDKQADAQETVKLSTEAADELNVQLSSMGDTLAVIGEEAVGSTEAMDEFSSMSPEMQASASAINQTLAEMEAKWSQLKEQIFATVKDSIINFEDLQGSFQKLRDSNEWTVDSMISKWQGQEDFYTTYSENLAYLAKTKINGEMLQHFSDGSVESAAQIQALVDELNSFSGSEEEVAAATAEFIAEFNAQYEKTREAGETFAEVAASNDQEFRRMAESIDNEIGRLIDNMDRSSEAAAAGGHSADGYLEGLASRLGAMYAMGVRLAREVMAGYDETFDIHSPSREARRAARDTVQGYLLGYEDRLKAMQQAGEQLATAVSGGYDLKVKHIEEVRTRANHVSPSTDNRRYDRHTEVHMPITINAKGELDKEKLSNIADYVGRRFRSALPEVIVK